MNIQISPAVLRIYFTAFFPLKLELIKSHVAFGFYVSVLPFKSGLVPSHFLRNGNKNH